MVDGKHQNERQCRNADEATIKRGNGQVPLDRQRRPLRTDRQNHDRQTPLETSAGRTSRFGISAGQRPGPRANSAWGRVEHTFPEPKNSRSELTKKQGNHQTRIPRAVRPHTVRSQPWEQRTANRPESPPLQHQRQVITRSGRRQLSATITRDKWNPLDGYQTGLILDLRRPEPA